MNISRKRSKKRISQISLEDQLLFDEMCDIMGKLGIEVRHEIGYFKGGICTLEDRRIYFINKSNPFQANLEMLIEQLKREDLNHLYISPRVRQKLEVFDNKIEA
jgi:hypothetical protein